MRWVAAVVIVVTAATVASCSKGPSSAEVQAFNDFALERQMDYPAALPGTVPTSIREYVLGSTATIPADAVVSGAFTDAHTVVDPSEIDPTVVTLIAEFTVHKSLVGNLPATFEVNLGSVHGTYDVADAVRGAGDVVIFIKMDSATGQWVLADGRWAIAQSTGSGVVSMPLVPNLQQGSYLAGITDVADIEGLLIAASLDPNGTLTDLGNDGITDSQQDLIDKANDLVNSDN